MDKYHEADENGEKAAKAHLESFPTSDLLLASFYGHWGQVFGPYIICRLCEAIDFVMIGVTWVSF